MISIDYSSDNSVYIKSILSERSSLSKKVLQIDFFLSELNDLFDLLMIAKSDVDFLLFDEILLKFKELKQAVIKFEIESLFITDYDFMNSFMEIHAGSGGIDAQDWVSILFKMYTAWFVNRKFNYDILSFTPGDPCGFKSISIKIYGKCVFGWLKGESGIHRLVRKSPFDSSNKRHTSFASVYVYPDNKNTYDVVVNDGDLKIETFRSSGAGGQHVNTTDSAVRITHIPTGIVVKCQLERSQHKNKAYAMKQLKSKLCALNSLEMKRDQGKFEKKLSITWGNQIRSYVLDKSLVKDMRTKLEVSNVTGVLNGNIDPFILSNMGIKSDIL